MITVATFTKPEEAHLLRMRLEAAGITAYIQDENLIQIDLLYSNALGGVRVQVADEDGAAVRELLAQDQGVPVDEEVLPTKKDAPPAKEATNGSWGYALFIMLLLALPTLFILLNHRLLTYSWNNSRGGVEFLRNSFSSPAAIAQSVIHRAIEKKNKGDLDGALADYDLALLLKPNSWVAYVDRGMAKKLKGDLKGAISDYDQSILLKPDESKLYLVRARAREDQGDLDGALADCNKSVELAPNDADSLVFRGWIKKRKGDQPGALADCNQAALFNPNDYLVYQSRGYLKKHLGDLAGATADLRKTIELNPHPSAIMFHVLGCLLYDMREFAEALTNLRRACDLEAGKTADLDYSHFRIYLARSLLNENQAATEELKAYLSTRPQEEDWRLKIGQFLCDQLSEPDFLKAADVSDETKAKEQKCEAWFYAGTKRLIAGDKATARDYFQKCVETGLPQELEHGSAEANLKMLDSGR